MEIDSVVTRAIESYGVPGIGVGVIAHGQTLVSRGYGTSRVGEESPVTEHTLFPIGSCTKTFTSFLLGQLVEEGLISWDEPVSSYVPEFQSVDENPWDFTIRDLIAHRTGFPAHDAMWFCRRMSRPDVIGCLQHLQPIHPPGEKWIYNNFMYTVAGQLIERVSNQSWEKAIRSRIFSPLAMSRSNLSIGELNVADNVSHPHAEAGGSVRVIPYRHLGGIEPAGSINSTVSDLLKWLRYQLDLSLKAAALQEMHVAQIALAPTDRDDLGIEQTGYGLGWMIGSYHGHPILSHGGDIDGFHCEILLAPENDIGIVILTNSSTDGRYATATIRNTILDRLLGFGNAKWKASIDEKRKADKRAFCTIPQQVSIPSDPHPYLGRYDHPAYGTIEIYDEGAFLFARYAELVIPLRYKNNHTLEGPIRPLRVYGIHRIAKLAFSHLKDEQFNGLLIEFEPAAGPVLLRRASTQ